MEFFKKLKMSKKLMINKKRFITKFPNKNAIGYILKKKKSELSKKLFFLITINKLVAGDGFEPPTFRL